MILCKCRTRALINITKKVKFSTKAKHSVTLDEDVNKDITKELFKPRNHPGRIKIKAVAVPDSLVKAIEKTLEDHPIKSLLADAETLINHINHRVPPMEPPELRALTENVKSEVQNEMENDLKCQKMDDETRAQSFKDKVIHQLKIKVYHWMPMNYDVHRSLVYLVGRFAPEYAALMKIFAELSQRDPSFKPMNLFDFGSGVGTVTWAAREYWADSIKEYFNVDASADMNDLARILLQDGRGNKQSKISGVFYRQFLPATNVSYDLVVSAYSLLELPSFKTRMDTIIKLWNKTHKYLVIVEKGTNAGYKLINEARDFILQLSDPNNKGHVFSPCPHDFICPRFAAQDRTPCNFPVSYYSLPLGGSPEYRRELYSYVVLKKGERDENDDQWPRVVREILVRSKHSICRLCTSKGKLEEVIFTASKHGKTAYHCARSSDWGDLLPFKIEEKE